VKIRRALALLLATLALTGCSSTPRRGGYYQDDGPGGRPPVNLDKVADAEPKVEPLRNGANSPYTVFGQKYVPYRSLAPYRQRGVGSWYGRKFHGQPTSSGERYDMYAMTAAHPILPIPSYARVTNLKNGRSVIVRVNDRGPFHPGRIIDLSYAAAYKLGYAGAGSAPVEVEAILPRDIRAMSSGRSRAVDGTHAPAADAAGSAPGLPPALPAAGAGAIAVPPAVEVIPDSPAPPEAKAADASIPVATEANGVYLQLGAFSARDSAENFRAKIYQQLAWLNQPIEIQPVGGLYRLRLGPYRDRTEAGEVAERISESLELKPVVVVR
jgi:rare lipoprotein A